MPKKSINNPKIILKRYINAVNTCQIKQKQKKKAQNLISVYQVVKYIVPKNSTLKMV